MAPRLTLLALLLVCLFPPSSALAQGPVVPPEQPPPTWSGIPDLAGYVSFSVPTYEPVCETEPAIVWNDPTSPFRWLAWRISTFIREIICFLLNVAQFFANVFAELLNAIIFALNSFWRFLVFSWLTIRSWLYAAWYLFEVLRDSLRQIEHWLLFIGVWLQTLIELFFLALQLVGQAVLIILGLFSVLLNGLAWVGAVLLGPMGALLATFDSTAAPVQLTGTHPVYEAVRGFQEALLDSDYGWLVRLIQALCYVGFLFWSARFSAGKSAE